MTARKRPTDSDLSDDARGVAGSQFGMMLPGGTVTFATPSRMSPRTRAGFDELVAKGVASVEELPDGSLVYRPLVECEVHARWLRRNASKVRFPILVPESTREPATT